MKGIVQWFVLNPIAANLLMVIILLGGYMTLPNIPKEFFPERKQDKINISVVYPGAGPQEVEQQVVMRVEEAVRDLDGIEELVSSAKEGIGSVSINVRDNYNLQRLLNDVKARVDAITTFPVDAERPQVTEQLWKSKMISVAISGDISEASLKELGEQVREELSALPSVSLVELSRPRNYEVAIEVSEQDLRRYGLRFDDVVNAVRGSSLNLPAGKIRAENGDIRLQTRAQGYVAEDFENIVLLSRTDGTRVLVGDVAKVRDGFEELDLISSFNDKPSLSADVYVTSKPDVLKISADVNAYVEKLKQRLPDGISVTIWQDMSLPFKDRLDTLKSNGIAGMLLVFAMLMIFLRPKLALWCSAGIPIAIFGALWVLPSVGISLNMVSSFAFILVLGILVDDAIVVGEEVYNRQQSGMNGVAAAREGASSVITPVTFSVVSTMIFFVPLLLIPGNAAEPKAIAWVVLLALAFSLIESMLILPSHLAHMKPEKTFKQRQLQMLMALRERIAQSLVDFSQNYYRPFLAACLNRAGLTATTFMMSLVVSMMIIAGGWLGSSFFPNVPVDTVSVDVKMPEGGPFADTRQLKDQLETAAQDLKKEYNKTGREVVRNIEVVAYDNSVRMAIELGDYKGLGITSVDVGQRFQAIVGELPQADSFDMRYTMGGFGKPIEVQITADTIGEIRNAAQAVREKLAQYPGVFNVRDTLDNPRPEIELRLKPQAETLNLTLVDLAQQVRRGFYGEEVQRIPRAREDVKVMVRYPENERASEDFLRQMRIRTPDGQEVPFETVADVSYVPGFREIQRLDGQRTTKVTADLLPGYADARTIIAATIAEVRPQLIEQSPRLDMRPAGEQKSRGEFVDAMKRYFLLALIVNFGIMAILFRSYWQPIVVLTVIPFGIMGAVLGHVTMGEVLSMFSFMGILATSGVVVNNNILLIDRINELRKEGMLLKDALLESAVSRFRPIILTSVTTFLGTAPLMFGATGQSQFLVPMVISLSFGVMLSTVVALLFTPCFYLLMDGFKSRVAARVRLGMQRLRIAAAS